MKKFVFTLFAVAALIACQSNNKQNQMTGEGEAVEIVGIANLLGVCSFLQLGNGNILYRFQLI